jgi:phenylpyruvate tautomerase
MPLIQIFTSAASPPPQARDAMLRDLSRSLAAHYEKSERWVMTCLVPHLSMTFGGDAAPCCFAAVKNVGELSSSAAVVLSADLCETLSASLGVPRERIYIEFTESKGRLWGWNGETFG